MKAFTFMSLLALALGSFSARAADSGNHQVNLIVSPETGSLNINLSNFFSEKTDIDFDVDNFDNTNQFLATAGWLYFSGTGLTSQTLCTLHISSLNGDWTLKDSSVSRIKYGVFLLSSGGGYNGGSYGYADGGNSVITHFSNTIMNTPYAVPTYTASGVKQCGGGKYLHIITEPLNERPETGIYTDTIQLRISAS